VSAGSRLTLAARLEAQTGQLKAVNARLARLERELDRALRSVNRYALTELRERSGYSKTSLARDAGVSLGHLTDIESGRRNPSPEVLTRLAAALKVPVLALLAHPTDGAGR
jgi:DNA-binding XRE family transcriptional regulator